MKQTLFCVLMTLVGTAVLSGCCTSGQTQPLEYKVAFVAGGGNDPAAQEKLLNNLAKEGWELVERDATGLFYLVRPRR